MDKKRNLFKLLLFGSKKSNAILALILGPYFLFSFFPNFTFQHKIKQGRFSVYSHEAFQNPKEFIRTIESLVSQSEIDDNSLNFTVYITSSHLEYSIFAPFHRGSFAFYNPLFKKIYINKSDVKAQTVSRPTDKFQRTLENTIAHEAVHKLTHHHLGIYKFLTLPTWLGEGYPDYIAGRSTYSYKEAAPLIEKNKIESNISAMYLVYLESVKIFKEKNLSFDEILALKKDWSEVKEQAFSRIVKKSQTSLL